MRNCTDKDNVFDRPLWPFTGRGAGVGAVGMAEDAHPSRPCDAGYHIALLCNCFIGTALILYFEGFAGLPRPEDPFKK